MPASKMPWVVFRYAQNGIRVGYGYLMVVGEQPWLCAREEDRNKDPRLAKMLLLDPKLLLEQPKQPGDDRQTFFYLAPLLDTEQDDQTPPSVQGRFQDR
jgi:hypothetical protein